MIYNYIKSANKETFTLDFSEDYNSQDVPIVISQSHPSFEKIKSLMNSGELDEMPEFEVADLLISGEIDTEIVKWADEDEIGRDIFTGVTLNGNAVPHEISEGIKKILSGFDSNSEDHANAILNFIDRVEKHPNGVPVKQFLSWAMNNGINLTKDGMIVGYKSVLKADEDHLSLFGVGTRPNGDALEGLPEGAEGKTVYHPSYSGPGITDGIAYEKYIPMYVGATVEMPRDKVDTSGSIQCSVGLHVGNYDYARGFNGDRGVMLLVLVDPADIGSVPDYAYDKYRVTRYKVIAEGIPGELDSSLYLGDTYSPVVVEDEPEPEPWHESDSYPEEMAGTSIAGFQSDSVVQSHADYQRKESAVSRLVSYLGRIFKD